MKNFKTILALLVVAVLMVSFSTVAFADGFVNSTYNKGGPRIVSVYDADDNDVTAKYTITFYKDRKNLTAEQSAAFEAAFKAIDSAKPLTNLADGLQDVVGDKNAAVSDFFFLSSNEEVKHPIKVKVNDGFLSDFAAAVCYENGQFVMKDSEVNADELTISGIAADGPVAFVVTVDAATSPNTGDTVPYGFFAGALVLVCAAAFFFVKSRKA